jgi:branched-subunit amino acid ABC-type transport system permease component
VRVILASVPTDLLPFVVIGLVAGSLYGLAATGLVLTYKTSGIFNFSHGAIGAGAAFAFYDLRDRQGLPGWLAFAIAVGVLAPMLGLVLARLAARLEGTSTARRVVATLGVLLTIQGAIQLRYGQVTFGLDSPFPTSTFRFLDVAIGWDQVTTTAIAIAAVGGLELLFRRTRLGLQMRAVVDNGELLDLAGTSPARVQGAAWAIGAAFAGLSGVLLAPSVGLDALILTLVVVQAFGAAAIGRFRSTSLTFAGGLVIGVAAALLKAPIVTRNVGFMDNLSRLDTSLPFLVLFAVLLFTRRGEFTDRSQRREPREPITVPRPVAGAIGLAAAASALALPHLFETRVPVFTLGAVFVVVYASLFLLVEVSNQVSLCHVAFVAIGATTFVHVTTGAGLPWGVGVLAAAAVAVPVGAFVAIPAIRLSGLFLALATLGFGILVEQQLYSRGLMFGALGNRDGARPDFAGLSSDAGYFYLCLAAGALAVAAVVAIKRSRLGRLLNALADSPIALATHGTSTQITRVLVFCISASMAAVGGALLVGVTGSVSSSGTSAVALVSFNSLLWLVVLSFVGRSPLVAPVLSAFVLVVAPSYITDPRTVRVQTLVFGVLAIATAVYGPVVSRWVAEGSVRHARRLDRGPARERTRLARAEAARG